MSVHIPQTLNTIIAQCAVEAGDTLDPSHNRGDRERLIWLINGAQRDLWDSWEWEGFDAQHDIRITPNQNLYNIPDTIDLTRTTSVGFRADGEDEKFLPMQKGYDLYVSNMADPDSRPAPGYEYDKIAPPRMFRVVHNGTQRQLEVWPRPSVAGYLRFTGTLALRPMVEDSDMSLLDGRLIATAAAAMLWSTRSSEEAATIARHLRAQTNNRMYTLRRREGGEAGSFEPQVGLSRRGTNAARGTRWNL